MPPRRRCSVTSAAKKASRRATCHLSVYINAADTKRQHGQRESVQKRAKWTTSMWRRVRCFAGRIVMNHTYGHRSQDLINNLGRPRGQRGKALSNTPQQGDTEQSNERGPFLRSWPIAKAWPSGRASIAKRAATADLRAGSSFINNCRAIQQLIRLWSHP
jgi:hypothetical protein